MCGVFRLCMCKWKGEWWLRRQCASHELVEMVSLESPCLRVWLMSPACSVQVPPGCAIPSLLVPMPRCLPPSILPWASAPPCSLHAHRASQHLFVRACKRSNPTHSLSCGPLSPPATPCMRTGHRSHQRGSPAPSVPPPPIF